MTIETAITALSALLTGHAGPYELPAPLTVVAEGQPRSQRGVLIQDVEVSVEAEDTGTANRLRRMVNDALRADPTLGGLCLRTVVDPSEHQDGRAYAYVRFVVRA